MPPRVLSPVPGFGAGTCCQPLPVLRATRVCWRPVAASRYSPTIHTVLPTTATPLMSENAEPRPEGCVALAHRPDLAAANRDRLKQPPGQAGARHADHRPGAAVPVLDQRRVRGRGVTLADRPHIGGPGRGHAVELIAEPPRIRARHHGPLLAVKVLDQRAERAALALLDADGPHVAGRHRGRCVEDVTLAVDLRRLGDLP